MIFHNKPTLGKEEEEAVIDVIRSGWIAKGHQVEAFENEFCRFVNLPQGHAVAVSSGTAALFLALWGINSKGKIVSFPVYTCSALRNAVAMNGSKERLLDTMKDFPNINSTIIKDGITDIVIVPHMFGIPVDISDIKGIRIIEDCCQSLGATIDGRHTGLTGDAGVFSFYATKLITSGGQGGMVISKDKTLIDSIRDFCEFDMQKDHKNRFNFQMTDLQAAMGRVQLTKLHLFLNRRRELFELYSHSGLPLLNVYSSRICPNHYRAIMLTDQPDKVIQLLRANDIHAIVPIQDWELLGAGNDFPNALNFSKKTVSLPLYPSLSDSDAKKIISVMDQMPL